jgi:hypothetical protein
MKTLFKKLNFGILLIGLVILTSCGGNFTVVSASGIKAIHLAMPSLTVAATKYAEIKLSKYFEKTSEAKNKKSDTSKKVGKASQNRKAQPIIIGVSEKCQVASES